ncbi:MAG: SGNH/GDSL hydrolase family protein [Clostridia bacterium]|nr:SGNH/GDSL hydrolase family protein [Clostridia bacterium]
MYAKKILSIFGDSIMKGLVFSPSRERYILSDGLRIPELADRYSIEIQNFSRVGCTIDKGVAMIKRRIDEGAKYDYIFLEYGGNDCDFNWKAVAASPRDEHLPFTPLDKFTCSYYELISYLRSEGIKPVMANLPPVSASRYLRWICRDGLSRDSILEWLGDENAIYRYQETYSRRIEEISRDTGTPLINLRDAFLSHRRIEELICVDGIHPNEQGQKIINEAIQEGFDALSRAAGSKAV